MSIRMLSRHVPTLLLIALLSGCSGSSILPWSDSSSSSGSAGSASSRVSLECRLSRSSCLYDGKYESGERQYAEDEAKRLNRAELERLRRAFGG